MDRSSLRDVTRREFERQAEGFERPGSLFRADDILEWIAGHVPVNPDDTVLDVAGGTGQVGRRLARSARLAVVVDLTPAMLETGAQAAREAGERDVVFVEGDATSLPFASGQFDVAVSRFAFHHIDDVAAAAREMARVCRSGGTVAVIDMACEVSELGARHNELERLRDPSHVRALSEDELVGLVAGAGVDAAVAGERRHAMPVVPWLDQAGPPDADRARILAALEAEAGGGEPTGLHAHCGERGLGIEQRWVIVAGRCR
jgi:SAM-dependent methyltransferase